ncbi:creatininase family protein [Virgibacillus sp. W0430]|uniref:creatininase family protein n=1 Tax=Virgibacillus sp. W0430 TaxID=3391580 RepID=UPI003F47893D
MRIDEMTREEVEAIASRGVAIIPVGAIEQHGPHLPLSTDATIIDAITNAVCAKFKNEFPVFSVPVVTYGNSHHHFPYPTLSLTSETLIAVLKDLTESLATFGCKQVILLNSHGGNDEAIRIVARDMSQKLKISIGAASYWTLAWDRLEKELDLPALGRVPGHAGGFETSLMLALKPAHVKMEKRPAQRKDDIPTVDNARRIYISRPNNSVGVNGYSDDARNASKDIGMKILSIISDEVYQTVRRFIHA